MLSRTHRFAMRRWRGGRERPSLTTSARGGKLMAGRGGGTGNVQPNKGTDEIWASKVRRPWPSLAKVFCFFFSKKKVLLCLPCLTFFSR
jgi:hypothetical protein